MIRNRHPSARKTLLAAVACLTALPALVAAQESPSVVAVLRFDNDTGNARYDNLGRGLAAMMISDLSVLDEIQLVERERLEELQAELDFQQSPYVDPATAQTTGLMVGAEFVITGSFMTVEPDMRIGTRIVDVETTEIRKAAEVQGPSNELFELQQQLAETFIDGLGLVLTEEDRARLRERQEANRIDDIRTVLAFSRTLCYLDAGAYEAAVEQMIDLRDASPNSVLFDVTLDLLQDRAAAEVRRRAEDQARSRVGRIFGRNRPAPRRNIRPPGC
ncbi:MAG: CsgG/HfaB family protein [Gemmatimonadetes bacterium]|nr:CsgG/HfaB family protein [Gemmatimonadota bacterium]